jgi:hypothetical protein
MKSLKQSPTGELVVRGLRTLLEHLFTTSPPKGFLLRASLPINSSPDAPWKDGRERSDRWKETLRKGFLPRVSLPINSSPDAPWKDGRERSDRWKETLRKGFLPRVSLPINSSPDAPWKDGRERSDRWKETLRKGFLPRVSMLIFLGNHYRMASLIFPRIKSLEGRTNYGSRCH